MNTELTLLTNEEQVNTVGGGWLGCAAAGALFGVGAATGQIELCLGALIAGDQCC